MDYSSQAGMVFPLSKRGASLIGAKPALRLCIVIVTGSINRVTKCSWSLPFPHVLRDEQAGPESSPRHVCYVLPYMIFFLYMKLI